MTPPPEGTAGASERGLHVLVVSHGPLAGALVAAARKISACELDQQVPLEALEFDWSMTLEECEASLRERLAELPPEARFLILTTLFGDTAFRAAAHLAEPGEIEVLGGINLPALIKLTCTALVSPTSGEELGERVDALRDRARASIERAPVGCGSRSA